MKASSFLKLVGEMMTAQQDYYKARKGKQLDAYGMLVRAKELEKQVLAVVQAGKLEPDPIIEPKQVLLFANQCQILLDGKQRCSNNGSRTIIACDEFNEPCLINVCVECWQKL